MNFSTHLAHVKLSHLLVDIVALGILLHTSPHSSPAVPELLAHRQRRSLDVSQSSIGNDITAV